MTYYKPGAWNAICDVCGFRYKSDELRKRWDGFMVCSKDYETRNPLDFLKLRSEDTSVPWSRPDTSLVNEWGGCDYNNAVAIPNQAVAGCAVTGRQDKWGAF